MYQSLYIAYHHTYTLSGTLKHIPNQRSEVSISLHQSTDFILQVPEDARLTHPQAGNLGAPLEAGEKMYIDLQKSYV